MSRDGWLPCGVSGNEDIFGTRDQTISFTITFPYTIYNDDSDPLQVVVDEWFNTHMEIDPNDITINEDGSLNLLLTYSDDICTDVRGLDYSDIDELIIDYMNNEVMLNECDFNLNDPDLTIEYDIHR